MVTQWARAPTSQASNHFFEALSELISVEKANVLKKRDVDDCLTYLRAKDHGLLTNYGEVTNNSSEQGNNSDLLLRSLPIGEAIIHFIDETKAIFARRLQDARQLSHDNVKVSPKQEIIVVQCREKYGRNGYQISINKKNCNRDNVVVSIEATVTRRKISYEVSLNANTDLKLEWHERIKCPCGYTMLFGRPCYHSSVILTNIDKISDLDGINMSIWWHFLPKWYSTDFSIQSYIKQYDVTVQTLSLKRQLLPVRLYPPQIKPRGGRKKKARIKTPTGNGEVAAEVSTFDDYYDDFEEILKEDCYDNESGDDAVSDVSTVIKIDDNETSTVKVNIEFDEIPLYIKERDMGGLKNQKSKKCSSCGKIGHYCSSCSKKDSGRIVSVHGNFLLKLAPFSDIMSLPELEQFEEDERSIVAQGIYQPQCATRASDKNLNTSFDSDISSIYEDAREFSNDSLSNESSNEQEYISLNYDSNQDKCDRELNENMSVDHTERKIQDAIYISPTEPEYDEYYDPCIFYKETFVNRTPDMLASKVGLRGFKWYNNSCAFDSVYTVLITLFYSLIVDNQNLRELFFVNLGFMQECFRHLPDNESTYDPGAMKQEFLNSFYKVIGNPSRLGSRFQYGELVALHDCFLPIFATLDGNGRLNRQPNRMFNVIRDQILECKTCSTTKLNVLTARMVVYDLRGKYGSIEEEIAFQSAALEAQQNSGNCANCSGPIREIRLIRNLPFILMLEISDGGRPITKLPKLESHRNLRIPQQLSFGDAKYTLMAILYCEGGNHFTSQIKRDNVWYKYDGMKKDGYFIPLDFPIGSCFLFEVQMLRNQLSRQILRAVASIALYWKTD